MIDCQTKIILQLGSLPLLKMVGRQVGCFKILLTTAVAAQNELPLF